MAKHIGAYSQYHGPAGKVLTDYVEDNIPALWNRTPERILNVGNTGSIYTGLIPGYTASEPFAYTADKTFYFTPHIPCNDSPRIALNTLQSMPILLNGLAPSEGDLQPDETYTLVTLSSGSGFTFNLTPGLSNPASFHARNFSDLGAREGSGVADVDLSRNNAALTLALCSGKVYHTEPGSLYRFSSGTISNDPHLDDSGLVGNGSSKTIFEMASGANQFDSADFHTQNSRNKVLIHTTGKERQHFHGLHIRLEAPPAGTDRACYPFYFGNAGNLTLGDLEFSNFKHNDGGLLRMGSLRGITRLGTIIARDCNPDWPNNPNYQAAFNTRRQITIVEIDNYKVASVESTGQFIFSSIEGYNLLPTKAVRDNWLNSDDSPSRGAQTDVFNPQTRNPNFSIIGDRIIGISTGEPLDTQSDHFTIGTIFARNVYDSAAVKIVYGSSFGSIGLVDCDNTALGVIYIQPANPGTNRPNTCQHIHISCIRATNVGGLFATEWEPRGNGMFPGVYILSSNLLYDSTTNFPDHIHLPDINISGAADLSLHYGVIAVGGPNNFVAGKISTLPLTGRKAASGGPANLLWRDTDMGSEEPILSGFAGATYNPVITFTTQPTGLAYTAIWRGHRAFGWVRGTIQLVITSAGTGGAGPMHISLPSTVTTSSFFSTAVDFSQLDLPTGTFGLSALAYEGNTYLLPRLYGDSLPAVDLTPAMLCPGGATTTLLFNVNYMEDVPPGVVPVADFEALRVPADLLP